MDETQEMPQVEMPRYQSHKKVWALEIKDTSPRFEDERVLLIFSDPAYASREVSLTVVSRYWPKTGDYFVVYEDGYESVSPKKAFEEGYTRING